MAAPAPSTPREVFNQCTDLQAVTEAWSVIQMPLYGMRIFKILSSDSEVRVGKT